MGLTIILNFFLEALSGSQQWEEKFKQSMEFSLS